MSPLASRRVLVTGGTRGIGRAVALACVEAGASVVVCGRDRGTVDEAVADLSRVAADRVDGIPCDVTCVDALERALDLVESRFGPLTTLIHAAGVLGSIGPLVETPPEAWWEAVRINLFGTFLAARQGCRRLVRNGGGRVVLFSGGGAATPFPRYSAYACSKSGVVRLAETLALEMEGTGVEVNAIAPGMVATQMHEQTLQAGLAAGEAYLEKTRRMLAEGGYPVEKAAAAAVFLASDAATGISGRLLAAAWDDWPSWPAHADEIARTDLFTLRRIVPADRGGDWSA